MINQTTLTRERRVSPAVIPRKVLMVGLGGVGQRHLRNIRALLGPDVDILAYRVRGSQAVLTEEMSIDPSRSLEAAYRVTSFRDLEEALAQQPDVAVIANPTALHIPVALACAQAGCHLLIEKPLSHSLEGVDRLLQLVEEKQLVVLMGYQFRFHPGLELLHRLLREQAVGAPLEARLEIGEYLPQWHPYEDYRTSYAARAQLGGGAALTQIHELDMACWLFGAPRRVFAIGGRSGRLEVDAEDTVSALLSFPLEDGRLLPVHVHMDYLQQPPVRSCLVVGSEGKMAWDDGRQTVQMWNAGSKAPHVYRFDGLERNHLFLSEWKHFLACLTGQASPKVSLWDGLQSLKVALAVKRSMLTGEAVTCDAG